MTLHQLDGYCSVHDDTGVIVAQGRREMCERIIAGWSGAVWLQGDLFDA